jgi:hypothetical protein
VTDLTTDVRLHVIGVMNVRWLGCLFWSAAFLRAETTPFDQPLEEEREITIACELSEAPRPSAVPVFTSAKQGEAAKGTYHYKLWLPKGYLADPERRWPCMFISSPTGNAAMGTMGDRLKQGGYVCVMLVEAKNGPWEPIIGNFLAAHDDAVKRVRIQEGLKFATGFSGGARASSIYVQIKPGFSGLIMQGAGAGDREDEKGVYAIGDLKRNSSIAVAMIMGESDKNNGEIEKMKKALGPSRVNVFTFPGGHQWAPAEQFDQALDAVEKEVYVTAPARAELKPAYLARLKMLQERLAGETAPWGRYKALEEIMAFARARNLGSEASVFAAAKGWQAEMLTLRKDPVVAKEALAADALRRLEAASGKSRSARFAADCMDIVKRYPGTEAATRAQELASAAKP